MPYRPPRPARRADRRAARLVALVAVLAFAGAWAPPAAGADGVAWRARLVDAGGEPVAGARVTVHPLESAVERGRRLLAGDPPEVLVADTSGADGQVSLSRPGDVPSLLRVRADGFADAWITLSPGPSWSGVDGEMVLIADRGLAVRVLDPDGEPVAGARVHLSTGHPFSLVAPDPVTTGDDGRLHLPRVTGLDSFRRHGNRPLPVAVRVLPPVGRADLAPSPPVQVEGGLGAAQVTLPAARPRTLVLRAPGGAPAAGALVALAGEGTIGPGEPLAAADATGRVRLPEPLADPPLALHVVGVDGSWQRLELTAPRRGGATAEDEAAEGGDGDEAAPAPVELVLRPPTPVHLRLVSAGEGSPLAGGTVFLLPDRLARSGADGGVALLVPDDLRVADDLGRAGHRAGAMVFAAGHEHATVDLGVTGLGSAARPVTVRLEPMAALSGRVVGEDGVGLAAAWVGVTTVASDVRASRASWPGQYLQVTTGAGGAFSITDLPPGQALRLRVEAAGHVPAERSLPALARGESSSGLVVELVPGHTAVAVVSDTDGRPVPGARLGLTPHATGGGDRSGRRPVACDPQGTCRADGLSAGAFDLEATAPGHAPTVVRGVEIPDVPPAVPAVPVDLGTLYLEPAVALAGRVTDAGGSPVAGAEVRVEPVREGPSYGSDAGLPRAVSGDDGSFRLDGLAAGRRVHLVAAAPGYAASLLPAVEAPRDDLEVRLEAAAVLAGWVVDEAGRPVADVRVSARPVPWQRLHRHLATFPHDGSDEDGRFELTEVPPGGVEITVWGESHSGSLDLELAAGEERRDLRLELHRRTPPMPVLGRVVDEAGRPISGAEVVARVRLVAGGGSTNFARTGAEGAFALSVDLTRHGDPGRQPLRVDLAVDHADYSRHHRELPLPAADGTAGDPQPLEIVLRRGGTEVAGVVVGADGTPLEGARVALETPASEVPVRADTDSRQAISGPDGGFRFRGVDPDTWRLSASHPEWVDGGPKEPLEVGDTPVEGLRVVLDRGAVLTARVSGLDERRLAGVRVEAVLQGDEHRYDTLHGTPDYRGEARLPGAAAGLWRLSAHTADGLRDARAEVEVRPGDHQVPVELDFGRGSSVRGVLVANGEPRAGVLLMLSGQDRAQRALTDVDGRFHFEGVADGAYSLSSFQPPVSRQVTVRGDTDLRLEVESVRISLHVVDPAGAPLAADVEWRRLDTESPRRGTMSGSSDVRLELPPGSYGFSVRAAGYVPTDVQVEVDGGDDDLRVVLEPGDAAWLDLGAGAQPPPDQVLVQVTAGPTLADTAHWYGVGADGRVRLDGLLPGRSELRVSAPGRAAVRVPVEVPGPPVAVALPPGASLQVTVPALARARSGSLRILDSAGRPLSALSRFGGRFEALWGLAAGGTRVEGLPAGTWTVVVSSPGAADRRATVTLAAGATTEVVLE